MDKKIKVNDWRLGKEITNDLYSVKYNFNLEYIKEILNKHKVELNLKFENIDKLSKYFFDKGKPTGKKRTSFLNFFEFTTSKSKKIFWLSRGWSEQESKDKSELFYYTHSNYKRRLLENGYTEHESDLLYKESYIKGKKTLSNREDYNDIKKKYGHNYEKYLNRINPETKINYTIEEAKNIVSEIQRKNSKRSWDKHKINPRFDTINTRIEFYLKKGLSIEDAQKELSMRQIQNGLNYYISKYGLEIGKEKYTKRIIEYGKKIKELRMKYPERWIFSGKRYSESSKRFFDSIIEELEELKNMKIYYAQNEFFLWDKKNHKIYFYDFYIKELNIMIEYHGIVWHPKERHQPGWKSIYTDETSEVIYDKDKRKEQIVKDNGIDLIVIYEDEINIKKQQIINELYKRINTYKNRR